MTRLRNHLILYFTLAVVVAVAIWGASHSKEAVEPEQTVEADLRGVYTYPGFGACFVPRTSDGLPLRASLTLAIFFSGESKCYDCMQELGVYRRLDSVFRERGQRVVAVTSWEDSTAIDSFLCKDSLNIPLVVSFAGMTFEDMGISSLFGPFKILFDSTLSMIYKDGANSTSASQANFEAAMLWLSAAVHDKAKTPATIEISVFGDK